MNRLRRTCHSLAGLQRRAGVLLAAAAAVPAVLATPPPHPPGWNKNPRCPPTPTWRAPAACPAADRPHHGRAARDRPGGYRIRAARQHATAQAG
jgi:hypothetical protein